MDFFLPTHAAVMVGGVGYVCHGCHGQKMVRFPIGMVIQPLVRTDFDTYCKDDHIWGWMTTNHIPCGWPWHMWIAKVVEPNWSDFCLDLWILNQLRWGDNEPTWIATLHLDGIPQEGWLIFKYGQRYCSFWSQIVSHSHIRRYDDILWCIMISYSILCYILM